MFTFGPVQFSEVFLNIKPFLTYMGCELYTRYVTIPEVIDPAKFITAIKNLTKIVNGTHD